MNNQNISVKNVRVHNLKGIDLSLQTNQLIAFTGISGSGKSSMAFDTLYVEGQRRYIESLSTFARKQIGEISRPEIESAEGITPTIAIEQKTAGNNPRSTVGTLTEIYDYLRVLFARIGIPHCPVSGEPVMPQSRERIIKVVQSLPPQSKILILAPYASDKKGEFKEDFQDLLRKGFTRVRVDGNMLPLSSRIELQKNVTHTIDVVVDRLVVKEQDFSRIAESLTTALDFGNGTCTVLNLNSEEELFFSMHAFSKKSGLSYQSLEPHDFSFNSPHGMCERCHGMGQVTEFDIHKVIDPKKSIAEDCCQIASSIHTIRYGNIYSNLAEQYSFDIHTPWEELSSKAQSVFLYGTKKRWTRMVFVSPKTGKTWVDHIQWQGVLYEAHKRYQDSKSERHRAKMRELMVEQTCPECDGERLRPFPRASTVRNKRIGEITKYTIEECLAFFSSLQLSEQEHLIADEILKELKDRLTFLLEVGLHYLTLDRTAPTLSGGEAQRVRLASQIGCGLVGITYILDEPSIGLHPRDNHRLINTLRHLASIGNTVIVVEHDEETIWAADHVVDFGPGAGHVGGEIVVSGDHRHLLANPRSLTGQYLSHKLTIPIPKKRRKPTKAKLTLTGATHHNLKKVTLSLPLGLFVSITGVSGSGKSSLITDTLQPALSNLLHKGEHRPGAYEKIRGLKQIDKVIGINQSPIGRNPRSNPATYIKLFDEIRDLFTQLPESKARGYTAGRFSFNVAQGSCPECCGMGQKKVDLDFLDAAWVCCPLCEGRRFDPETLSVYFKGKNIYDVLELEIREALSLFEQQPGIMRKLKMLSKVGLDYLKLGQSSTTLSGGEAQRVKLARELVRPSTGKTLYILDEPTTGLHFHDIHQLLNVLQELTERGNTVLVIEHNMDVVKTADWVIDLGPDGGDKGGEIIAQGSPEQLAKLNTPTGRAIYTALHPVDPNQFLEGKTTTPTLIKPLTHIEVQEAEQNNLKRISLTIPREKVTVCTGPSGSGKSSLAFETIYAEGQRRYVESLSPYARQFVKQMPKPKIGSISGLSPSVAIEQKAHAGNPRSTVGTLTEVYDLLRVLFARLGVAHCPETGEVITSITKQSVVNRLMQMEPETRLQILAPLALQKNEEMTHLAARLSQLGFVRVRFNRELFSLDDPLLLEKYDPKQINTIELVVDRLVIKPDIEKRLFESIEQAAQFGRNQLTLLKGEEEIPVNLSFSVPSTGKSYPEITPHTFAFNTPSGMCPECDGLGYLYGADLLRNPLLSHRTPIELFNALWKERVTFPLLALMQQKCGQHKVKIKTPLFKQSKQALQFLLNGEPELTDSPYRWIGLNTVLAKLGKVACKKEVRFPIQSLLNQVPCFLCEGSRLNALARSVTLNGTSLPQLTAMPIDALLSYVTSLKIPPAEEKILKEVLTQIKNRLQFMLDVGLEYLTLSRTAPTLSGGEAQRIRLARQLGCGLKGILYVLDEPTIGLHPKDTHRLLETLTALNQLGNTLILVEHEEKCMEWADHLIDFGPGAGNMGGHITQEGTYGEITNSPHSLTGQYLSQKKSLPLPKKRRKGKKRGLKIEKANHHNLQDLSLDIPTNVLCCLTGVSGSGKSTLMHDVIQPAVRQGLSRNLNRIELSKQTKVSGISQFDRLLTIDQNPVGHTIRSDVCTYADILTPIRHFFAELPLAKARGLLPKHFSYNHRSGMCTNCYGIGYRRVEMHFLPAVKVRCEECNGLRLNPVSLEVCYQGKNLGDILQMTIEEVQTLFAANKYLTKSLSTLCRVGLGYLKLGQEIASLSGGESQRIKLSRELAKKTRNHTLYLIDEPSRGLHFEDLSRLIPLFHELVDKGNSILLIEHHIHLIQNADFVIDLGPGAGEKGGRIVASGTPEDVASDKNSVTGPFLQLKNAP